MDSVATAKMAMQRVRLRMDQSWMADELRFSNMVVIGDAIIYYM
jgi:hypothetical protein